MTGHRGARGDASATGIWRAPRPGPFRPTTVPRAGRPSRSCVLFGRASERGWGVRVAKRRGAGSEIGSKPCRCVFEVLGRSPYRDRGRPLRRHEQSKAQFAPPFSHERDRHELSARELVGESESRRECHGCIPQQEPLREPGGTGPWPGNPGTGPRSCGCRDRCRRGARRRSPAPTTGPHGLGFRRARD